MKTCETCRWWKAGLRRTGYGACASPDVGLFLLDSGHFSPSGDFSCAHYEPSVAWAEDAAAEIADAFRGIPRPLPDDTDERIEALVEIILKHKDQQESASHRSPRSV